MEFQDIEDYQRNVTLTTAFPSVAPYKLQALRQQRNDRDIERRGQPVLDTRPST